MKTRKELEAIDRAMHSDGPVRAWLRVGLAKRNAERSSRAMIRMAQQAKQDGTRDARDVESGSYREAGKPKKG